MVKYQSAQKLNMNKLRNRTTNTTHTSEANLPSIISIVLTSNNLSLTYKTADKLFFVLDYCGGGELFFHLGKVGRFPEERAKFYAAQITLALEYVHGLDIIYR